MALSLSTAGWHLRDFAQEVQEEYWGRGPFEEYLEGVRQPNTVRLVAGQVLEAMTAHQQAAVMGDLLRLESIALVREPEEVLQAADSVGAMLFDLACEACWQILVSDVELRIEDEIRAALAQS
jgi:hypothetical protein